jgi:hypothetical protein
MSYAFTRDVPAGEHHYAEVRAAIGAAAPEGRVVHLVVRRDGGLRYIGVWDSEAHRQCFHHERIGPAVRTVMAARGMTRPATSPPYEPMELIDAWLPARGPRGPGGDAARAGSAPRLAGIHHLKVHVTDVRRSALWYQRVLGYRPVMEFSEATAVPATGSTTPAAARSSRSGSTRTTRRKPRAGSTSRWARPTRPPSMSWPAASATSASRTDRSLAPRPRGCSRTCTTPTVTRCAST